MRKNAAGFGLILLLFTAGSAITAPVDPVPPVNPKDREEVGSYNSRFYPLTFRGGELARVVVSGNGKTSLGLYVYDEHGNCVAKDDLAPFTVRDDLAVEWFPRRTARYTIEVKNFGRAFNRYLIAIR